MLNKLAESVNINMSHNIPSSEIKKAVQASERFKGVAAALENAMNKLDLIYDVFKRHENISTDAIVERRGVFKGRFRLEVIDDFQKVLTRSFKAIEVLNHFSIDSDIAELVSSFEESVDVVKDLVDEFTKILRDDYEKPDFRNQVIGKVDGIRKEVKELDNLIYDRIVEHLNTNIIANNWKDQVSNELNLDIQNKEPLIVKLYKEREGAVSGNIPDVPKEQQAMNPSDAQRAYYPDRSGFGKTFNIGE